MVLGPVTRPGRSAKKRHEPLRELPPFMKLGGNIPSHAIGSDGACGTAVQIGREEFATNGVDGFRGSVGPYAI